MERQKLELEVNKPTKIKLLFNDCIEGSTPKFGKYFLYAVRNGDGSEYSLFAADQLHEELKKFKKDDELLITKLASQRNNKLVVAWEVKKINEAMVTESELTNQNSSQDDFYYTAMEKSFDEAVKLQQKFSGVNISQVAISIFIQRTRGNHSFAGG